MFQGVSESMFKVTHMIMNYAPIGVFALIAVTVANFGFASLLPLAKLVMLVYVAIAFFAFMVLGLIARLFGFSVIKLMRIFKDELVLAYSTASSETVLPRVIEKMEAYGAPKSICSFVVPTGYSFNLDGSTLYQSIAAIFIAQLYGIDLSISQQLLLVLTLMVTSKGIAGVPGVSFVVLLATLGSVGIPLEGLAFIAGVDRIMDMARTALNVIGNALAAVVIAVGKACTTPPRRALLELAGAGQRQDRGSGGRQDRQPVSLNKAPTSRGFAFWIYAIPGSGFTREHRQSRCHTPQCLLRG
jgi:proton glutamate symport protein